MSEQRLQERLESALMRIQSLERWIGVMVPRLQKLEEAAEATRRREKRRQRG